MLHRHSPSRRLALSRSKSTSSIVSSHVEREAYIAAKRSYHRAQGRSCDMPSTALGRSNSVTSSIPPSPSVDGSCALHKEQSVRFVGPNARPRRLLAARANRIGPAGCVHGHPQASSDDHNMKRAAFFDGLELAPSAGRLRKSRSMMTSIPVTTPCISRPACEPANPLSLHSQFGLDDDPADRLERWLTARGSEDMENEGYMLRAPKSMTLLRGHSRTSSSKAEEQQQAVPVSLHHSASRSRLRSHPSLFFRSRNRRCNSSGGMAKSLRNSSNDSSGISSAVAGNAMAGPKQSGIRVTARKVSRSLRSRFKGLFGRPRSADDVAGVSVPPFDSDAESCQVEAPEPEEASMSRVPSHVPSIHAVPSHQQLRSRKGSLESICVDGDERSRVTSWTNSTNTMVSECQDSERQRLSVIDENVTHAQSAAWSTPAAENQRVYSALFRKLDERWQQSQCGTSESFRLAPPCRTSIEPGDWPTIRCVPDDDVFQDTPRQARPRYKAYPNPMAGDSVGLSPARRPELEPRGLAHNAAFLASPTCHLFRTASPFRRALKETMEQGSDYTHALDTRYLSTLSALSLPTRRPSTAGSGRDVAAYADSMYSDEQKSGENSPDAGGGDGAIFTQLHEPMHNRDRSADGSARWRAWLGTEASDWETPTSGGSDHSDAFYALPFGHVREEAEIESPDTKDESMRGTGPRESPVPAALGADGQLVDDKSTREVAPRIPSRNGLRTAPSLPGMRAAKDASAIHPVKGRPSRDEQQLNLRVVACRGNESVTSSPGLTTALKRQFRKASLRGANFATPRTCKQEEDAEWKAQVMGSKRMVDLFLSSRRRRIDGSTGTESDGISTHFCN
ncbi:hypothetical protein DCS_00038 [Drechmeria coniospora]|uniref:Uncharacterized protein n=1 Tax=Drechmeria coniospora TaxID=98403 RepID=A0A151GPC3_DRECN|nr:hypothetical protein DCS_00038 [Drechmeria coniospora]KYK58911.1 hypothetical protein DCS_00038 [Drechmeria coniospora]